jgi:hypothetical protein
MRGGRFAVLAPDILQQRYDKMGETYARKVSDFEAKLSSYGLSLEQTNNSIKVAKNPRYAFGDVKALDLHHLTYDFPQDINVSKINVDLFVETADKRSELLADALTYIKSTQPENQRFLPVTDVSIMKECADKLRGKAVLPMTKPVSGGRRRASATISLDTDFSPAMKSAVQRTVHTVSLMNDE